MTRRTRRALVFLAALGFAALVGPPVVHLAGTFHDDVDTIAATREGYADDVSRMNAIPVKEVWPVPATQEAAERQLVALLQRAHAEHLPVSIAGARHSMGGHTIAPGGIVIDMLPLNGMHLDADGSVLTVQAGALWSDIIPYLDRHGRSVAIMQSDNSFSVGGSLSVNVHGWQTGKPPVIASVKSFRLLLADGSIVRCSREENAELFSLVIGGYGLFGIILDAELWTVPNEWYAVERLEMPAEHLASVFREQVDGDGSIQMAYGRLRVTREGFLQDATLTLFRRTPLDDPLPALEPSALDSLKRTVFRGSVDSDYGKNLRWNLESTLGEKITGLHSSRNQLLDGDVALYSNRANDWTDILHEYFLPPEALDDFIAVVREVVPQYAPDLLNVTVRDVRTDTVSFLRYADRDMLAVVMLFNQARDARADADMKAMTQELVQAALEMGGRYYLPYRLHASQAQFLAAYPQATQFAELKRSYDPEGLFSNRLYDTYFRELPQGPVNGNDN